MPSLSSKRRSKSSRGPVASFAALPVELRIEIVGMAVDEGRYEDLDTLKALGLVCKAAREIAAPMFWRSLNLYGKNEKQLSSFFDVVSIETKSLVRHVFTFNGLQSRLLLHDEPGLLQMYAQVAACLPELEGYEECFYSAASKKGRSVTSQATYARLSCYALYAIPPITCEPPHTQASPPLSYLELLDPTRLTRLSITNAPAAPPDPSLSTLICRFPNLTHLKVVCHAILTSHSLSAFSQHQAPLVSLHLHVQKNSAHLSVDVLFPFLKLYSSTLELVSVYGTLSDYPLSEIDLPRLRHLSLATSHPQYLAPFFSTSPLETLVLSSDFFLKQAQTHPPTRPYPPDARTILDILDARKETLKVLVLSEAVEEVLVRNPVRYFEMGRKCGKNGVKLVFKSVSKREEWEDLDALEE
ncbi:hypothetical protein JCM8547_001295 [Rhodosporidiobolus lusitaniae]